MRSLHWSPSSLCSKNKDKKSESNSQQTLLQRTIVRCCVRRTKIKNLKAIHNPIGIGTEPPKLCSKNKDKKSESNSQRLQFNMSGCIPYRRRPPPVRNMRAVLKKASWCTRRVFRSPPCSKQASGVQKGYSVPETPFYGTEQAMCTGKGLLVYRLKRRNVAPALRSVILRKTAICMLLLLPLNSRSQLWTPSNYRQLR